MQQYGLAGWLAWHVTCTNARSSNRGGPQDAKLEGCCAWQHNQNQALMGLRRGEGGGAELQGGTG